jgi:hypothetical protein
MTPPIYPLHPGPGQAAVDAGREFGRLLQPQVGQPQRLGDRRPLRLGGGLVAGGELADGALAGEVPVDRAAGPAHQLLQLGEQRHLPQQVLRGAAARAEARAAEEGAEPERVAGVAAGVAAGFAAALRIAIGQPEAEGDVAHVHHRSRVRLP